MLIKSLPKIAARVLKNTWGVPQQYKPKLELVEEAYGSAEVEADFEKWCEDVRDRNPRYPVSEYLKIIDSRLGSAPKEDERDPRVEEISALAYRLTHRPAPTKNVRDLLTQFSLDEITSALREYVEGIEERELAYAVKMFFVDGGCSAVLTARKQREQDRQKQIQKTQAEKKLIDSLIEQERQQSDARYQEILAEKESPKPTAKDLFGAQ